MNWGLHFTGPSNLEVFSREQQRIDFSLLIRAREVLNISESIKFKFNHSDPFILTTTHWFISTGCNEYAYNVDIKLIPNERGLIHKVTHLLVNRIIQKNSLQRWFISTGCNEYAYKIVL